MTGEPALSVDGVTISARSGALIVQEVSFQVDAGEVLGIVGESGSGKTTLSLATLAYARPGAAITQGHATIAGQDLLAGAPDRIQSSRGRLIAYIPQDPATALNPSLRVETLLREMLRAHRSGSDWRPAVTTALAKVGLPADAAFRRRFPHQLSGGQQQRLAIAIALICEPSVLVMDEPTTGLDVITQSVILAEIKRLCRETGVAIVYVSHDLAVVSEIASQIAVMYAGRIVEHGPAADLLQRPRHPYTLGLISSIPDHREPRRLSGIPGVAVGVSDRPPGCAFAPRCGQRADECEMAVPPLEAVGRGHSVRCIRSRLTPHLAPGERREISPPQTSQPLLAIQQLRAEHRGRAGNVVAADQVTFSIGRHECLALVGESGSGKTTIARCVAGLHPPASGTLHFDGQPLAPLARQRPRDLRRRIQIVFQNPYDSLNPKHTVEQSIARPLLLFGLAGPRQVHGKVAELLGQVRLPAGIAESYPAELSGGERQRVAIARAIAAAPDLLICDEVTSALDVSVQAVVLDLLADLRRRLGLAVLFITHDLGVVASVADTVLVLEHGTVREEGPVSQILSAPSHPYTRALIAAAPSLPKAKTTGPEQAIGR
jgi:peptide/nickel transport system ATP-binding protein